VTVPAPGRLVVVADPGAGEPSARATEVLGRADRVDGDADVADVVARVAGGATVALVTSGGPSPSVGVARLVGAVVDAGLVVEVVPAPLAAVAALVASGLATDHVAVEAPLPPDGPDRATRLAALAVEPRTTALPVAAEDVVATLAAVATACGSDRPVAVAGDDVWRGTAAAAATWAAGRPHERDVVLVIGGAPEVDDRGDPGDEAVLTALRDARARGLSPGRAAAEVAAATGRPRREVYALGAAEDGT
jgi:16S rRNA (cytidine1402-2'-O)-methyltransferase